LLGGEKREKRKSKGTTRPKKSKDSLIVGKVLKILKRE